jgi:hypothetical protein
MAELVPGVHWREKSSDAPVPINQHRRRLDRRPRPRRLRLQLAQILVIDNIVDNTGDHRTDDRFDRRRTGYDERSSCARVHER